MATGLKLNGVDFEDIFEKTRDSSNEKITNLDYNFQTSGAGLYSLRNFLSADPAKPYQSVADGGSIDLATKLIQSPVLEPLVLKGRRPRMDSPTWSHTHRKKSGGPQEEIRIRSGSDKLEILYITKGSRGNPSITTINESSFPDGKIPEVIFFIICAGGGGARGFGLWPFGNNGGGGGGGGIILGWTYTDSRDALSFYLGGGGSKGIGGLSPTAGGTGNSSQVFLTSDKIIATAYGGGGSGKEYAGSGGGVTIHRSSPYILATKRGGNGKYYGDYAPPYEGYIYNTEYDKYYISSNPGSGGLGGGASLGSGAGGAGNDGIDGSGGSGPNFFGNNGGAGGDGVIKFFY